MTHHAHPISEADHALMERKTLTAKALSTILAAALFGVAVYFLFFRQEFYLLAAGVLCFVGSAFLAYSVSGIRLGRNSKIRHLIIDHSGMSPETRNATKRERKQ